MTAPAAFPGFWIDTESRFLTFDQSGPPSDRHAPLTTDTAAEYGLPAGVLELVAAVTAQQENQP